MSSVVVVGAEGEFKQQEEPTHPYQAVIEQALIHSAPVKINFNRVIPFPGNPGGIMLAGFPNSFEVQNTRQRVKGAIDAAGLRRHERRPLVICHITLCRWETPMAPDAAQKILALTERLDYSNQAFWSGTFDKLSFVIGGYNTSPANTTVLKTFKL